MELLDEILDAHGGAARWRELTALRVSLRCRGDVLSAHGQADAFARCEAVLATDEPWLVVTPFHAGRGYFRSDCVWHERDAAGVAARERQAAPLPLGEWDALDALAFAGPWFWRELCAPYTLLHPALELQELAPLRRGDGWWRRLRAAGPDGEAVYSVDERGLLCRRDGYCELLSAAVVTTFADYRGFDGLLLPTRRRVLPRAPGEVAPGGELLSLRVDAVEALAAAPDAA